MTYDQFTQSIASGIQHTDYYDSLMEYSQDILLDIAIVGRQVVSDKLGMSYMKLTHILPLLTAIAKAQRTKDTPDTGL